MDFSKVTSLIIPEGTVSELSINGKSVYSGVKYSLMDKWYFNNAINWPVGQIRQNDILFVVESHPGEGDYIQYQILVEGTRRYISVGDRSVLNATIYNDGAWTKGYKRDIEFMGKFDVSKKFYDWFIYNAKPALQYGYYTFTSPLDFSMFTSHSGGHLMASWPVKFKSNGIEYRGISMDAGWIQYYGSNDNVWVYDNNGWIDEKYKKIYLSTEQIVDFDLYRWLRANAKFPIAVVP